MRQVIIVFSIFALLMVGAGIYLFVKKTTPLHELVLYGNVDVRQVDLGFRVYGRVETMPWQEGQELQPGELMATIDKQPYLDAVREAEANVLSVRANLENAKRLVKRRKAIVKQGSVSEEDYENNKASLAVWRATLKQAKAALGVAMTDLSNTEIYCPSHGTILTRIREPGTIVNVSEPVYTLSISSPVWVRAFAQEDELPMIELDMLAEVHTDTPKGKVYHAHVGFISPVAEFTPKTVETTQLRTDLVYRLRIYIDDPDKNLRQGMPVTVKIPLKSEKK